MLLALLVSMPTGMAATEEEINDSINAGVAWLAEQQNPDGSWGLNEKVAHTGFAVLKLTDRARELGYESPFDSDYEYSDNVTAGVAYITDPAVMASLNGDNHETYNKAIALMALSNLNDATYSGEIQSLVDWLISTQKADGGWRYPAGTSSDNSNTGYAVLGLAYAEDAGLTIPATLQTNLSNWVDYIQNDQGPTDDGFESDPDGGSGYTAPSNWVNSLKTGNLIFEMGFVGDDTDTQRMQYAVDYLERHWNDVGTGSIYDVGWKPNHYQAMYAIMKGLEYNGIETLEVDGSEVDWFDNFSDVIVDTQNPDGSWPVDHWGGPILSTEWALLTLEKTTPVKIIDVSLDVKPSSCPNPINVDSKGVLPIAIAGSEDFDVTRIDPATVEIGIMDEYGNLTGVSPLRWSYEDVTCLYFPEDDDPCCIENQPDGITDLSMKFKTQELVGTAGLEDYSGETINLTVTGITVDGLPILGQDCVRIQEAKKKGKNK
jgi:hypothetical protein